ncbi:MAG: hypothetical protein J5639_07370 [Bacteroidales bacterium]|nr:hypothetical protein [Bacteroidales bacterium]
MDNRIVYETPAVIREYKVELEGQLLAGSVVTKNTTIETAGQKVDDHSFGDTGFDSKWE